MVCIRETMHNNKVRHDTAEEFQQGHVLVWSCPKIFVHPACFEPFVIARIFPLDRLTISLTIIWQPMYSLVIGSSLLPFIFAIYVYILNYFLPMFRRPEKNYMTRVFIYRTKYLYATLFVSGSSRTSAGSAPGRIARAGCMWGISCLAADTG